MLNKIGAVCYTCYNIIRIIAGSILAFLSLLELWGIAEDPGTYQRVYTGEMMGDIGHGSLDQLIVHRLVQAIMSMGYIYIVALHMKRYSRNIWFIVLLAMADICFVAWTMYKICNPPNI